MFAFGSYVESGGLISYAASASDNFRRAAGYVDKILKGEKPGDLPIEQPTRFECVVNMKSAKAMGLKIPDAFLIRVDRDDRVACQVALRRASRCCCCSNCATTAAAITSGSLPAMPGTPIGQVMRAIASGAMPRSSKRCMKRWRLVFEPIRPEVAEVGAAQDRFGDAQVQVVLVRQHEVERAGRRVAHFGFDASTQGCGSAPGRAAFVQRGGGEFLFALVEPVDADMQRRERVHDRAPDMAGAVELQMRTTARAAGQRASAAASRHE